MKTLYLHIGTPKTATTSLQHFCEENETIFKENNYCYPLFPRKFRHINILRNGFFLSYKCYDENGDRREQEEEACFRQGMDMVLEHFRTYDNVVLSDESMWSVAFKRGKPELWEKIRREADENNYRVKVIVYLRRQDSLADSWWNQKVKNGKRIYATSSWEDFTRDPSLLELHYYEPIKRIEQYIGKENMILRRFVISNEDRNIRLFGNTHEIKRVLNMLPELSDADNLFFKRITISMSEQRTEHKGETMFSAEEALEFMEPFREGNRKLMEEYFGKDEDLFRMDFSKNRKWTLDNTEMERDIISFIGSVAVQLRQENRELRARMQTMEKEWSASRKKAEEKESGKKNPLRKVVRGLKVKTTGR